MTTKYGDVATQFAEGRGRRELQDRASLAAGTEVMPPSWYRYVVLDVISDPTSITPEKLDYWEHELGVINLKFGIVAPRNAIVAQRVRNNTAGVEQPPTILYPFFPPHLSLPCNAGEHVWAMFEDVEGSQRDLGYWFCRIVQPGFVEDVNFSHADRRLDPSFTPNIKDVFEGSSDPVYEFPNGTIATTAEGERYAMPDSASLDGDVEGYETLMRESDAGRLKTYESVARFRKRPEDLVLEGSNNARIVIGRDRSGAVAEYEQDEDRGKRPRIPDSDAKGPGAGSIDIVVGVGQTDETSGKTIKNSLGNDELGKGPNELAEKEGDPDFMTDRSRVLLSQRTSVDVNFGLSEYNEQLGIEPNEDAGCIAVKSDKLRLIARSDVEVLVTGFDVGESGLEGSEATSRWASITLKSNGDIIIKPSEEGLIRLGGEDADKALVCTDSPAIVAAGKVAQGPAGTPPLTTTMGGTLAGTGTPTQGMYASKVLVTATKV